MNNAFGYNDRARTIENPEGRVRIVVVGDVGRIRRLRQVPGVRSSTLVEKIRGTARKRGVSPVRSEPTRG